MSAIPGMFDVSYRLHVTSYSQMSAAIYFFA